MRLKKILLLSAFALLAVIACRLTAEDDKEVHTLTLESLYDTLSKFDNVQIQLKDGKTGALTVIFNDKVDDSTDLRNLAAPGYDGKSVTITITATNGGVTVYKSDRVFDGTSNAVVKNTPYISPNTKLLPKEDALRIYEGDTLPLPRILISPADLADTALAWKSLDLPLLVVRDSSMIGVSRGIAKLVAKLKSDPSKELVLDVTVAAKPGVPDSLSLEPETLFVAAKGAAKKVKAVFTPVSANPALNWHSTNEDVAVVSEAGAVYGVVKGMARVWAASKIRPGVFDSIWVSVSERVPALTLRFPDDTLFVFLGGAPAPLVTQVAPPLANQEVDFTVGDPSKAELLEDRVKAKAIGGTWVAAVSRDNPSLKDSIRVEVLGAQEADSVVASPATFRVYTGGKAFQLTAQVFPSGSYAKVQWKSLNPEWATVDAQGRVSAVAPGLAKIVCTSLADSSKKDTVTADADQDPPVLTVGKDTTITQGQTLTFSPHVDQNYGGVAKFKWDVDGAPGWDDSADGLIPISHKYLKEQEVPVQFYVRDDEKNWDTVQFKVTVKPSPIVVTITRPGKDTLVNTPAFAARYTVNGSPFDTTVALKDGLNEVVIVSTSDIGSGRDSVRITLDSTAPVVKITSPLPNQAFNKDSVTVAWTVDGNAQTARLIAPLGKNDGKIDILRDSTDAAGNKGSAKVSVFRDTKPPKVAITSPKDSTHTKNGSVAVLWSADSVAQKTDTATLTDGLNLIKRKFTDAAGNTDSATARVYYHSKAPVVEILSPSDSTISAGDKITVSWTVDGVAQKADTSATLIEGANPIVRSDTDEVGQIGKDSLLVFYNPKAPTVKITAPLPGTVTNLLSIQVTWTVDNVSQGTQAESLKVEGENTITRKFKDGLGVEGVGTVKVIRDTKNPNTPTVTSPVDLINVANKGTPAVWNWQSGGDNVGGAGLPSPHIYRYKLDGAAAVSTSLISLAAQSLADGMHTFVVQEQDKAGNWSDFSLPDTIIVDKTPPTAPVVAGETPSADPIWTWLGGGGGNGTFRYRLDAAAYAGTTLAKRYNPSQVTDVDHTLYVEEQDDHGNWSAEAPYVIQANNAYPTVPSTASFTCTTAGSPTDTVEAEMDSEGYHSIFDGKTLKGWWPDCQTGHSNGSNVGAIIKVDPNARALFTTQNGTNIGGALMTNKQFTNYELVLDIWPKMGNDGGVFNRSPANGKCFHTTIDYIQNASLGGTWGEGGFTQRDFRPFTYGANDQTITIPGNSSGEMSNWTTITSKLNPTSYGCAPTGCVQDDYRRLWDANGWNEMKIAFYGGYGTGTGNVHMKSWFRKSGAATWVPLLQDTTLVQVVPKGYIGLQIHGGGRFSGPPGNWYRNIKIRELNDQGEPITLP
jgi:hypothetical protein